MKLIRKPQTNAFIITVISTFYAFAFIIISGHMEFERILNHSITLSSPFWNLWSSFIRQGNMKYIGYIYLALTTAIVTFSLIRKHDFDEYQASILEKGFVISGIVMACLFPLTVLP